MGKWILLLLAAFVALAIVGFLIDAARFLIGVALLGVVVVGAFQLLRGRSKAGPRP
jgi:hypothetical protein